MGYNVLYIEDNPDNMTLVRRAVEAIGLTFRGAPNGAEGLRRAEVESVMEKALLGSGLVAAVYTSARLLGDPPA